MPANWPRGIALQRLQPGVLVLVVEDVLQPDLLLGLADEVLLAGDAEESAERGFLVCLAGHRKVGEGDMAGAGAAFAEAAAIGSEGVRMRGE